MGVSPGCPVGSGQWREPDVVSLLPGALPEVVSQLPLRVALLQDWDPSSAPRAGPWAGSPQSCSAGKSTGPAWVCCTSRHLLAVGPPPSLVPDRSGEGGTLPSSVSVPTLGGCAGPGCSAVRLSVRDKPAGGHFGGHPCPSPGCLTQASVFSVSAFAQCVNAGR